MRSRGQVCFSGRVWAHPKSAAMCFFVRVAYCLQVRTFASYKYFGPHGSDDLQFFLYFQQHITVDGSAKVAEIIVTVTTNLRYTE